MTENYRVRYVRKTGGHPIEGLVRLAIEEEYKRGFRHPFTEVASTAYDHEALWIDQDGRPIAVLQFQRRDWTRSIATAWSYTLPSHRRQGLNRTLFEALQAIAKRDGYGFIDRSTHPDNHQMLAVMAAAGGVKDRITYRFYVEDNLDSTNDRFEFP